MIIFLRTIRFVTLLLIIQLFTLNSNYLFAQLTTEQQQQIRQYSQQMNDNKVKNQLKMAAYYSNKCASVYLGAGLYPDAIKYYLESADLNVQIGNDIDNKKIYNNVAMLYSEMGQLNNSIKYFEKGLLISRRYNNKAEIAVSLMDVSTILILNKEYDNAITYLEEALKISFDMDELQNLKTCYNLLSQCYKASGNISRSDEYHEYYLAYDKKIREGKEVPDNIKNNFLAAESKNLHVYEEKKGENDNQLSEVLKLKSISDSVNIELRSLKEKAAELEIKVLEKDKELVESKQNMAKETNKNSIPFFYIGFAIMLALIVIIAYGFLQLQKKKIYINELEHKISVYEKEKLRKG